ncbi:MAG: hypothetical protein DMG08_01505, partial [Acidobacteria bacterium]
MDPSTALRPVQGFPPVGFADGRFDNRFLNINGRPYDFPAAYSQQWNFTLGRQLRDYAIEVAYMGNKANKLMANRNINQPLPGAGSVNSRRIFPGWGSITFQEPHWLTTAISNSRCGSSGELTQGRPPQRLGEFVDAPGRQAAVKLGIGNGLGCGFGGFHFWRGSSCQTFSAAVTFGSSQFSTNAPPRRPAL